MRSWLSMSIVLYALGAALFVWSGFMLLGGDTFATIDIAASLAGWGAFTIGLGALTAALHKLTRAVADGRRSRAVEDAAAERGRGEEVMPVFVARGKEPAHFEPQPEPASEREPTFERKRAFQAEPAFAPEIEPAPEPEPFRAPAPEPGRRRATVAVVRPLERTEDRDDADTGKKDRRAKRLQARQDAAEAERADDPATTQVIAAPALGGRFMPRPSALPSQGKDVARPPVVKAPPVAIMPVRQEPDHRSAHDEPTEPHPVEAARRDAGNDAAGPPPPVADEPAPVIEAAPETSAPPSGPETPPAPDPVALRSEPKVPEWLARARARREARAAATPVAATAARAAEPLVAEPEAEPAVVETEPTGPEPAESPEMQGTEPQPAEEGEHREVEPEEAEGEVKPSDNEREPAAAHAAGFGAPEQEVAEAETTDAEPAAEPQLVREGEHNGVLYRFYDDGSVEAISSFGIRRFATVDDLRETVLAARGTGEFEPAEDAEPAEDSQPAEDSRPTSEDAPPSADPEPAPDSDALDAALAELKAEPPTAAPELRIDPRDRPARP